RRRLQRREQQRGDAEVLEVVELAGESGEIADAVAIAVAEAALEQVVEHLFAGFGGGLARTLLRRCGHGVFRGVRGAGRKSERERQQRCPGGGVHASSGVDGVARSTAPKKRS